MEQDFIHKFMSDSDVTTKPYRLYIEDTLYAYLKNLVLMFYIKLQSLFVVLKMTWRTSTTASRSTWSSLSSRPSASSTASTTPSCTPSWTRISRRAAWPRSLSASENPTSKDVPWWRPNSVCSTSNPKAGRPSWGQTIRTAPSSVQPTKRLRTHCTERALWKWLEKKSPRSTQTCLPPARRSNEENVISLWNTILNFNNGKDRRGLKFDLAHLCGSLKKTHTQNTVACIIAIPLMWIFWQEVS